MSYEEWRMRMLGALIIASAGFPAVVVIAVMLNSVAVMAIGWLVMIYLFFRTYPAEGWTK